MPTIKIAERVGAFVSSRASASALRAEVIRLAGSSTTRVVLDFEGVESLSDSFSDELLAVLVKLRGPSWLLEHVRIVNLGEDDRRDVERVVSRRAGTVALGSAFDAERISATP